VSLSKIPFGAFRQFFAVCYAHNLFACSEQIPHLQPEMCFCPRTRRGQKRFLLCFPLTRKILRSFFYSLKRAVLQHASYFAINRYRAGQGSNDTHRTVHALSAATRRSKKRGPLRPRFLQQEKEERKK